MTIELSEVQVQRFRSYVCVPPGDDSALACHEWIGGQIDRSHRRRTMGAGYGCFRIGRKMYRAHRVALMLVGVDVPDDAIVRHVCDRPNCVNPAHLRVGTQADNIHDMHVKRRAWNQRGHVRRVKLDAERVAAIRQAAKDGERPSALAVLYGVGQSTVRSIIRGRIWRQRVEVAAAQEVAA